MFVTMDPWEEMCAHNILRSMCCFCDNELRPPTICPSSDEESSIHSIRFPDFLVPSICKTFQQSRMINKSISSLGGPMWCQRRDLIPVPLYSRKTNSRASTSFIPSTSSSALEDALTYVPSSISSGMLMLYQRRESGDTHPYTRSKSSLAPTSFTGIATLKQESSDVSLGNPSISQDVPVQTYISGRSLLDHRRLQQVASVRPSIDSLTGSNLDQTNSPGKYNPHSLRRKLLLAEESDPEEISSLVPGRNSDVHLPSTRTISLKETAPSVLISSTFGESLLTRGGKSGEVPSQSSSISSVAPLLTDDSNSNYVTTSILRSTLLGDPLLVQRKKSGNVPGDISYDGLKKAQPSTSKEVSVLLNSDPLDEFLFGQNSSAEVSVPPTLISVPWGRPLLSQSKASEKTPALTHTISSADQNTTADGKQSPLLKAMLEEPQLAQKSDVTNTSDDTCIKKIEFVSGETLGVQEPPTGYRCNACREIFPSNSKLIAHEVKSHGGRTFSCPECEKKFIGKIHFDLHIIKHAAQAMKKSDKHGVKHYPCTSCDKKFTHYQHLRTHMETHAIYNCNICLKTFPNKPMMKRHLESHEIFKCEKCYKGFSTQTDLHKHMKNHDVFSCEVCGKKFSTEIKLKEHTKESECGEQCPVCKRIFARKTSLVRHMAIHNTKKGNPYPCVCCTHWFPSEEALEQHMKIHIQGGERKYECTICKLTFARNYSLRRHMAVHGEKSGVPLQRHSCTVCGKTFFWECTLSRHMITHSGEKPFKCTACDKSFAWASALTRHMKLHTGNKPIMCNLCGKVFPKKWNLDDHMKKHMDK